MNQFNIGDKVRLLPHIDDPYNMRGKIYIVENVCYDCFSIQGIDDYVAFDVKCFEKVA